LVTRVEGQRFDFRCEYSDGLQTNAKYFCHDDNNVTRNGKYYICDDTKQRRLRVTIHNVNLNDAGTYWCLIDTSGFDPKTEIKLTVYKDITKTHQTGETVQIKCPYPESHEHKEKFLCKGETPLDCKKLIQTKGQDRYGSEGRFAIRDNQRVKYFYVTIKNVNTDDSGTYWCGSDTTSQRAKSRKILLSVGEYTERVTVILTQIHLIHSCTFFCCLLVAAIIGGVVGSVAFILLVVAVVLFAYENNSCICHTAPFLPLQGNHGDHNYEEIQIQNQQASSGDALPAVNATANPPADQLFYASVNFQGDTVNVGNPLPGTDSNGSSACDYSSISRTQGAIHPPAAEQTIYTTVTKPGQP
uniref:Immunoglobulin domain-containing protein n=1 Tax=Sparus aurata TaxID=8175 RepID=A0A671WZC1_SPAAU